MGIVWMSSRMAREIPLDSRVILRRRGALVNG